MPPNEPADEQPTLEEMVRYSLATAGRLRREADEIERGCLAAACLLGIPVPFGPDVPFVDSRPSVAAERQHDG